MLNLWFIISRLTYSISLTSYNSVSLKFKPSDESNNLNSFTAEIYKKHSQSSGSKFKSPHQIKKPNCNLPHTKSSYHFPKQKLDDFLTGNVLFREKDEKVKNKRNGSRVPYFRSPNLYKAICIHFNSTIKLSHLTS